MKDGKAVNYNGSEIIGLTNLKFIREKDGDGKVPKRLEAEVT